MSESFTIRRIRENEIPLLISLINEMAEFEKLTSEVAVDERILSEQIFIKKRAEVVLAEKDNHVIGYCIYFYNFSSFMGRSGLYIEDIYIKPEYRGQGFGRKAFSYLEETAVSEGCARMEWACLNWNQTAIDFYEKNGASAMNDWMIYRKKLI
jgi:GNAT superfamily N-acetyltransferase